MSYFFPLRCFLSALLIFIRLFPFWVFAWLRFCAFWYFLVPCILFVLFVRVKSYHEKKKKFKTVFWYFLMPCILFVLSVRVKSYHEKKSLKLP